MYIYMSLSLSLSLSIYIYTHMYAYMFLQTDALRVEFPGALPVTRTAICLDSY